VPPERRRRPPRRARYRPPAQPHLTDEREMSRSAGTP